MWRNGYAFNAADMVGSREHYFHFLFGYLLPAIWAARTSGYSGWSRLFRPSGLTLQTCGPLMDPRIREAGDLFGMKARIARRLSPWSTPAPRWDLWFMRPWLVGERPSPWDGLDALGEGLKRRNSDAWHWLNDPESGVHLEHALRSLREEAVERVGVDRDAARRSDRVLLLKRSESHPYYTRGGKAEIAGYGLGRRGLIDVDEAARALRKRGLRVTVFEPGAHDLRVQIRTFATCRAVIAMRGAELANILWMRPGSEVVVITPSSMKPPSPVPVLSEMLGLSQYSLQTGEEMHQTLDIDRVTPILQADCAA